MSAAVAEVIERDWLFRPFEEGDENAVMYMLGVGYTRSRAGWRAGATGAGQVARTGSETPDHDVLARQKAFMSAHGPIWRWLLEYADVTLAVDPQDPSTIWGWMVTSGNDVVHALGVKRSVIKAGLGRDLVLDLAGDRWNRHQVVTLELPQLRKDKGVHKNSHFLDMDRPYQWSLDPTWLLTRMHGR